VGVQEVTWDKGGTVRAGDYIFFMEKENKIINWKRDFLYTKEYVVVSAVKRAEFVSDRMSYMVLKGLWFNITIVNVHAPSQEKSDDSKDSFYDELEQIFDNFPTYNIKILLLGDFNAELGKEYILKPTIGRVYIRIVMIMVLE
jgi:exonuclease III